MRAARAEIRGARGNIERFPQNTLHMPNPRHAGGKVSILLPGQQASADGNRDVMGSSAPLTGNSH